MSHDPPGPAPVRSLPETLLLGCTAGLGIGVATALGGVIVAPLFVPGTVVIGLSLLVMAIAGVMAGVGGPWFRLALRRPPVT